ncbi:MAG: cytochrome c [Flavobacteriaceae bacterium]|nr:cytochrome c [Flavobacteriaceae bacterium]
MFYRFLSLSLLLILFSCKFSSEKETINKDGSISEETLQTPQLKASIERGGLIYADFCIQCHLGNGKGIPGSFPPLAQSDWLTEKRTESIHAVKYGQKGEIEVNGQTYNGYMAPMGLTDEEVADVMNYIMNSWGNQSTKMVTVKEVAAVEK